jgi:hypothetical protein
MGNTWLCCRHIGGFGLPYFQQYGENGFIAENFQLDKQSHKSLLIKGFL